MAQLAGFKESGMRKIADRMGYTGPMTGFTEYLNANPEKQQMMNSYVNKAMLMASGGYVRKFQEGGFALPEGFDREEYVRANPDVLQAISQGQFTSAEDHYRKFGGGEQRLTQLPQDFDPESYAVANPDVIGQVPINPETGGRNRDEVAAAGLKHFREFGFKEERPLGFGQETQTFVPPPSDARDTVTQPPAEGGGTTTQPPPTDDRDTVTTAPPAGGDTGAGDTSNFYGSYLGPDGLPSQADFSNPTNKPFTPIEDFETYLTNRPDVAQAIAGGETFGLNPALFAGGADRRKKLAERHFQLFGRDEGVGIDGVPIQPPTGTDTQPPDLASVTPPEDIRFPLPPNFNVRDYLENNPDVVRAISMGQFASAEDHYQRFGGGENRQGVPATGTTTPPTGGQTVSQGPLPSWLTPPPEGAITNQVVTTYTNPLTGETYTTSTGGYTVNVGGATTPSTGTTPAPRPSANVNSVVYLQNRPDVLAAINEGELFGIDPATLEGLSTQQKNQILAQAHFNIFGARERINPFTGETLPPSPYEGLTSIGDISAARMERPTFPSGTRVTPEGIPIAPKTDIATTTGQLTGDRTTTATPATAPTGATATPQGTVGQVAGTTETAADVKTVTDATTGRTMSLTKAKPDAAQQTTSAVTGKTAETGTGIKIDPDTQVQRAAITDEEKVEASAEASEAAKFIESIKAETADPSKFATVAGQLENLLTNFDASNPPSWAAGAMRAATAELARRGFGASSIAGQAIVQAAMESALPIAQADASVFAQFEAQNLSNKQQTALFYAQQRAAFMGQEFDQKFQARVTNAARIADIADKNFNAQQQVQLENSNIVNTMNLNNLSNRQAVQMAEIAALAQLDIANLNNRQQAAVQEAQAFLQKDLTDVSNDQQTTLFNAQQRIQSMFTDAAADNARKQFNATSQNQSDQFFANLATQTSQFNDAQKNAINQFNAGQENTIGRFNEELNNQRDQFNAQNRLVIDQSNAQWRRAIATADTAATNRANELNAEALLDISNTAYNDLWQYYSDAMEFAWTSAENERTRTVNLAIEQLRADNNVNLAEIKNDFASSVGFGNLIGTFLTAPSSSAAGGFLSSFGSGISSGLESLLSFS